MSTNDRQAVDGFLSRKRLAVPVNPGAADIEGNRCFTHLLLTSSDRTEEVVDECIAATAAPEHAISVVADDCPFMLPPNTAWPHRLGSYPH